MGNRSEHLQIRLTPAEKAQLRRLARAADQDISQYVLSRVLRRRQERISAAIAALASATQRTFALAELTDALAALTPVDLEQALDDIDVRGLDPFDRNYVAAIVEHTCARHRVTPPTWTCEVEPLEHPWFATNLRSVRPLLLRNSPVPFKRRNLFVDPGPGRV